MIIDEIYLAAAVRIKRKYKELSEDMTNYESYLRKTLEIVEETNEKLLAIDKELKDPKKRRNLSEVDLLKKTEQLMAKLEEDAGRLETKINPINKDIEKLAVEEQELYRSLKDRYPTMSDVDMVRQVHERLKREGLG